MSTATPAAAAETPRPEPRPIAGLRGMIAAICLFFLAPLTAEYLLGDIPLSNLGAMVALAPMYGGGAILIRELVRRTQRGWPTFILLALAYALAEEALLTQSLFNPHFMGFHLLAYGYIPALGTALPWLIYVLSIHVIWSMAVPIGLTEALFAPSAQRPWLGRIGLGVAILLLLAGGTAVAFFQRNIDPFRISPAQMGASLILIVLLIIAAFRIPRLAPARSPKSAPAILVGGACFVLGSTLLLLYTRGSAAGWPWPATLLAQLIAESLLILLFWWATRMRTWTAAAAWSAATGGMLTYAWYGYAIQHAFGHDYDMLLHSMLVGFFILLAAGAGLRVAKNRPTGFDAPDQVRG